MTIFEQLVKSNMKKAYYSALGILGSHDAAMEISQQAFIRAYRNFHKYDKKRNFFTWYYKIMRNLCMNYFRDNRNRISFDSIGEFESMEPQSNPDNIYEKIELKEKLTDALNELEFEDREIIMLKEFENHSYKEIAEIMNIPVGTVMSKLFYVRKKLAKKLESML